MHLLSYRYASRDDLHTAFGDEGCDAFATAIRDALTIGFGAIVIRGSVPVAPRTNFIDVFWLTDTGGTQLLLPYLLRKHVRVLIHLVIAFYLVPRQCKTMLCVALLSMVISLGYAN